MPFRPASCPHVHGGQTLSRFLGCLRCLSSRPHGRDPRPPSPTPRLRTIESRSTPVHLLGPGSLGLRPPSWSGWKDSLLLVKTADRDRLAPPRVPPLLAPEVSGRPPHDTGRDPASHPADGSGEPNLGRSQDPWRTLEARLRPRRAHGVPLSGRHPARADQARSQTWATFLKNHARDIVAIDMFVVPTIRFQVLYIFIILGLERRRLIFTSVTTNPTAQWLAQQVVNAFPLGHGTELPHPRPRQSLRARLLGASEGPRYPGNPYRGASAADERLRRAGNRHSPPRVF